MGRDLQEVYPTEQFFVHISPRQLDKLKVPIHFRRRQFLAANAIHGERLDFS